MTRGSGRRLVLLGVGLLAATAALADWLQPDHSYREAQLMMRLALRDTTGHADDASRLDTLGVSLLRLGRFQEAAPVFRRALELRPGDDGAEAGLGKIALFAGRLSEAESLLAGAVDTDPGAVYDLYAARLRRGNLRGAMPLCEDAGEAGRAELLQAMLERIPYQVTAGAEEVHVPWNSGYPLPLVRVKLNGQSVLMALDTGARDLLVDVAAARICKVQTLAGQSPIFWSGTRLAVRNAMVQKLEIGGITIENLPAGITPLRKWSILIHPRAEKVVGVIGLGFLRAFTPTLDYQKNSLTLRRGGARFTPDASARRVPFEIWGESELTVYGSLAGGRRMAMIVQSGVPECGVGAPPEVFEEVGVRSGLVSRAMKGAGSWLQGRPWLAVNVPTVSVGPVVEIKVQGWSGALDPGELWRHGVRRDALLSHNFFRGKRVTLDWNAQELVFE
ncbi:MAG TPA: tetratricopeptide repeat protein [Candidatus Limnocylindria bacterium]|nr:tetratricopeptide repeat protein [Candidatus Limnocylindria bacterium]